MSAIIQIHENQNMGEGIATVNARELHGFLQSKRQFANWIAERIKKYAFIDGQDFLTELLKTSNGRPSTEYHLTLDMAKELAMVENNDKGREARRYFIEAEKKLAARPVLDMTNPRNLIQLAQEQVERAEAAENALMLAKPKVDAMERLEASDGSLNFRDAAKSVGWPPLKFNRQLCSIGWIYKPRGGKNWCAYQAKIAAGYLDHITHTFIGTDGNERTDSRAVLTPKGIAKLAQILEKPPT